MDQQSSFRKIKGNPRELINELRRQRTGTACIPLPFRGVPSGEFWVHHVFLTNTAFIFINPYSDYYGDAYLQDEYKEQLEKGKAYIQEYVTKVRRVLGLPV